MTEPMIPVPAGPVGTGPVPAVPVASVARPARRSGRGANALLLVAGLIAAGGIAFAVGRTTAPASTAGAFNPSAAGAGQAGPDASFTPGAGGPGGFGGSMTLTGTVTAVDGTKLTITTASGQTVTVDTSGAAYHSQATASSSDVATGDTVQVAVSRTGAPGADPAAGSTGGTAATTASDVTIVAGN
jgi:hypothetical protein